MINYPLHTSKQQNGKKDLKKLPILSKLQFHVLRDKIFYEVVPYKDILFFLTQVTKIGTWLGSKSHEKKNYENSEREAYEVNDGS